MRDTHENNNNADAVVVRLDETARNEAQSILCSAYREDPTFQYLFDYHRAGYDQRVRATVRELIDLYLELNQDAVGVMKGDSLVAVAFIGDPELRMNLADQFSWRIRMVLTAGFSSTRRYLDYHKQIRDLLPHPRAHQLPLMGVNPKYQNQGFGRVLLKAVGKLCEENPRGSGLVLDTGNSRYLPFYESEGFQSLGKIRLGDFEDHVMYREITAGSDERRNEATQH